MVGKKKMRWKEWVYLGSMRYRAHYGAKKLGVQITKEYLNIK